MKLSSQPSVAFPCSEPTFDKFLQELLSGEHLTNIENLQSRINGETEWRSQNGKIHLLEIQLWCNIRGEAFAKDCIEWFLSRIKESRLWGIGQPIEKNGTWIDQLPYETAEEMHLIGIVRFIQLIACPHVQNKEKHTLKDVTGFKLGCELLDTVCKQMTTTCHLHHSHTQTVVLANSFIYLLLRVIKPIALRHRNILAPMWRGLSNMCCALNQYNAVDKSCWLEMMQSLSAYIHESLKLLLSILVPVHYNEERFDVTLWDGKTKFVKFLLTRVAELLPLSSDWPVKQFSEIVVPLVRLRGLSSALKNTFIRNKHSAHTIEQLKKHILPPLLQLDDKLDSCFRKTIFPIERKEQGNTVKMNQFYMVEFLSISIRPMNLASSEVDDCVATSNNISRQGLERLYHSSLCFGKVEVLLSYLKVMQKVQLPNEIEISSNLTVSERLIFSDLPLCLSWISLSPCIGLDTETAIFQSTLSSISDCLFQCEYLDSSESTRSEISHATKTHRLLTRWLAPTCRKYTFSDRKTHPLTHEMVLLLANNHILRSYLHEQKGARQQPVQHLINLMAKLLFDSRTTLQHRRNIGIVFFRLLLSLSREDRVTSEKVNDHFTVSIESTLCNELNMCCKRLPDMLDNDKKRKRQRHDHQLLPIADLVSIAPLLEVLSFSVTFWSRLNATIFLKLFNIYTTLNFDNHKSIASSPGKRLATIIRESPTTIFLALTLLNGFITSSQEGPTMLTRCSANPDQIRVEAIYEVLIGGLLDWSQKEKWSKAEEIFAPIIMRSLRNNVIVHKNIMKRKQLSSVATIISSPSLPMRRENIRFELVPLISVLPPSMAASDVPKNLLSVRLKIHEWCN